ncbi:RBPJ-interacting and tubulin-associated protein 1 [Rhinatrema bivittatum]|uniref:RBPJ-interacting and tubulin-associated protein 1 n=1 Tax=Rhinatrema bivittatum TaxID=194408 RepID=UPI00112B7E41|nr:RBPJ-interacting and tubulin-associated protein 1 [Rhinatrema bivittatum]XP_029427667.1 RBPJ-interacting and tubulin-associated protein 1 [Rhinatrema bivittatum]XP_029427668.1 RBPJ-interacting and tubulin-associated protein 1 [Rhinatrema bivittatum]XP_029427669.1 RBPJ-interacting and tubulin-associated protein 1 [Rhinatrema bivittatum]XP_029427670.1 RBPJ-interacting and tubulin-associated protein 1 [Rhinatrema bivittatum]
MAMDLAVTGIQALRLQNKSRASYRAQSSTSFVDETLFRSSSKDTHVSNFESPWTEKISHPTPVLWGPQTPKSVKSATVSKKPSPMSTARKNKYRLKSHFPSYCDETLFGPKVEESSWEAPWAKKEDKAKLRPLLWIPLSAPKIQCSRPARSKPSPLKVIHSPKPKSSQVDFPLENHKLADYWQRPRSDLGSTMEHRHLKSLTPAQKGKPSTSRSSPNHRPSLRIRSASFSASNALRRAVAVEAGIPRPPWK